MTGIPPAYLSIPNYQNCLQHHDVGSATQLCLPPEKPIICQDITWREIQQVFRDLCSPPKYLEIPGYDLCLVPDEQTLYGWCKPSTRPAECFKSSWEALDSAFKGNFEKK